MRLGQLGIFVILGQMKKNFLSPWFPCLSGNDRASLNNEGDRTRLEEFGLQSFDPQMWMQM